MSLSAKSMAVPLRDPWLPIHDTSSHCAVRWWNLTRRLASESQAVLDLEALIQAQQGALVGPVARCEADAHDHRQHATLPGVQFPGKRSRLKRAMNALAQDWSRSKELSSVRSELPA
jgi:hypothetical protein